MGVAKFVRARRSMFRLRADAPFTPPVSLLKPLHGMEPQLERNLESFFAQQYSGPWELLFCARSAADPALQLAQQIALRYPSVSARFLVSGEPPWASAKVWSLELMSREARYDLLIISDSDVEVGSDYLSSITAPFRDAQVGCLTCLYRGKPAGGIWSRLEALGMSVEMTSGVVIANMLEGMKFALGPTMACRRAALADIGGCETLSHYYSDDFILGNHIAAAGWNVVLSDYSIDHIVMNRRFLASMEHQVRWMTSTRFSRPKGHFGTGLTFAVPYGILALLSAVALHHAALGFALFAWTIITRIIQSVIVGGMVVRDRRAVRDAWLFPLRDVMGFFFWIASYFNSTILWRGQRFKFGEQGRMVPLSHPAAGTVAARSVEPSTR